MYFHGRHLPWRLDPLDALSRWPVDRPLLMLHSGRYHTQWARWSILAQPDPDTPPLMFSDISPQLNDPFDHLRQTLINTTPGLWIGYLAYDLARYIEKIPQIAKNDRDWPLYNLQYCPGFFLHDAHTRQWHACGTWKNQIPFDLQKRSAQHAPYLAQHLSPQLTPDQFRRNIQKTIDYIAAGDIFQANLAQRFSASFTGESPNAQRSLFAQLARISPAWYGAYLEIDPQHTLASTSPELFLQLDHQHVITRPIKGTRPAQPNSSNAAHELQHSEKDTAELHMIVDLLRNDLGRVCRYGTVQVTQPRTIENHPTIHHGVATIEGQLRDDLDLIDLLHATLPGGSITGAPKIRAMQIIDELEPTRRGPYCGCIGYINTTPPPHPTTPTPPHHSSPPSPPSPPAHLTTNLMPQSTWNIAIRTLCLEPSRIDFSVGGGIVADSDPQSEYQETLDKAAALLQALNLTHNQLT